MNVASCVSISSFRLRSIIGILELVAKVAGSVE
jgi:hypothetical protein